jgi:hypothetical protein
MCRSSYLLAELTSAPAGSEYFRVAGARFDYPASPQELLGRGNGLPEAGLVPFFETTDEAVGDRFALCLDF